MASDAPREDASAGDKPAYEDPSLPIEQRVEDLVSRMTLEEKVSQMLHEAPAIPRVGIPQYSWWNECLHGVARAGVATVFPQAIGLAAATDPAEHRRRSLSVMQQEGRATVEVAMRKGELVTLRLDPVTAE